jgi:hypothetical protein
MLQLLLLLGRIVQRVKTLLLLLLRRRRRRVVWRVTERQRRA